MSPFRYPGAKSRLLHHFIDQIVDGNPRTYSEPFVGGGSVALEVACRLPKAEIHLNDLHEDIASFWAVIADGKAEDLCDRIRETPTPTVEAFWHVRDSLCADDLARAHKVIFLNRTSFSGMGINPIGGREQKSKWKVDCRWNPEKLQEKIRACSDLLSGRTEVTCVDATEAEWADSVYLDPPYYVAGPALYEEKMNDHEMHAGLADHLRPRTGWVLSYDDVDPIRKLYDWATIIEIEATYSMRTPGTGNVPRDGGAPAIGRSKELVITP